MLPEVSPNFSFHTEVGCHKYLQLPDGLVESTDSAGDSFSILEITAYRKLCFAVTFNVFMLSIHLPSFLNTTNSTFPQ